MKNGKVYIPRNKKLPRCECGKVITCAPLTKCRPCAVCGVTIHMQYEILYHKNPEGEGCSEV